MSIQPNSTDASVKIISQSLREVDEAIALMGIKLPNAGVDQLSLGPFKAHIDQADFGNLLVFFAEVFTPLHHTSGRRSNYVHFATELKSTSQIGFIHGCPLDADMLFSFDGNRPSDTIIYTQSVMSEVQICQNEFTQICQAMRRDDLNASFLDTEYLRSPTTLKIYQAYLRNLKHLIKSNSPLLKAPEYKTMILGDLVPLLIDSIPRQGKRRLPAPAPNRRAQLARQARDYIQSNLERPLTLKDIYTNIGTSRRTLYYSFESIFGMTPIDYLKAQRLQGVRRALKQSNPKMSSVANLAHQWGFWELSHFAKAYKSQFGELPSETLKRDCSVGLSD